MPEPSIEREAPSSSVNRRTFLRAGAVASGITALAGCAMFESTGEPSNGDTPGNGGSTGGGSIPGEPLKMGVTSFLSGPAAILGDSVTNTAEMLVDQMNQQGGILGERAVDMTLIDEIAEGGSDRFRQFATEEEMDVVIGYASTSNALEVAPLAEDLEQLTIFHDTGAVNLFEETVTDPHWTFRTGGSLSVEAVGAAQVVANRLTDVESVAGIHPDYGFGRGNQEMFTSALSNLAPDVEVVAERYPPLLDVNDYTPHIEALRQADPDFIFSVLWGGDLVTFLEQAQAQGLLEGRTGCFFATHLFGKHADLIPEGHLMSPRGPHFPYILQNNPLQTKYVEDYTSRFGEPPWGHTAYHFWNAFHAYEAAVEKAHAITGGWPSQEQIIAALEGISLPSPSGHFPAMTRYDGHQGVEPGFFGYASADGPDGNPTLVDPIWLAPELVNPPIDTTHAEWIGQLEPVR